MNTNQFNKNYLQNSQGKTVLLNSVQEFIKIQVWLLWAFFLSLPNQLSSKLYTTTY